MFKNFAELSGKLKIRIVLTMSLLIIPVAVYAIQASVHLHQNKIESSVKLDQAVEISDEVWSKLTIVPESVPVTTGIYMESITGVSVADNSWTAKFLLWFRWNDKDDPAGHLKGASDMPGNRYIIGNGATTASTLMLESHDEQTGEHYQQYRVTAKIEKYFDTTRYPLDSHQLQLFIEDERDMSMVRYVPDAEHSGISPHLTVAGFDILNYTTGLYLNEYTSTLNEPTFENAAFETEGKKTTEFAFFTRVTRAGYGLFLKAFLSLFGMLLWVAIGLYNCAYNRIDAMGAMNTGIFGAVSSMIVGMNLLSDARGSGLIEYVNFFALAMILITTIFVIHINRTRARGEDVAFTDCYAKSLFWCVVLLTVAALVSFVLCAML